MQESTSVNYTLTGTDTNGNDFIFIQSPYLTDASALALVENIRAFAWPEELAPVTVRAMKVSDSATTWQCNPGTSPAAFN
jgi:hypothetical protein